MIALQHDVHSLQIQKLTKSYNICTLEQNGINIYQFNANGEYSIYQSSFPFHIVGQDLHIVKSHKRCLLGQGSNGISHCIAVKVGTNGYIVCPLQREIQHKIKVMVIDWVPFPQRRKENVLQYWNLVIASKSLPMNQITTNKVYKLLFPSPWI